MTLAPRVVIGIGDWYETANELLLANNKTGCSVSWVSYVTSIKALSERARQMIIH